MGLFQIRQIINDIDTISFHHRLPFSSRGSKKTTAPRSQSSRQPMKQENKSGHSGSEEPVAGVTTGVSGSIPSSVYVTSAGTAIDFHSAEFNRVDDLTDSSGNVQSFEPLGDVITADMRHQMERRQSQDAVYPCTDDPTPAKKAERETARGRCHRRASSFERGLRGANLDHRYGCPACRRMQYPPRRTRAGVHRGADESRTGEGSGARAGLLGPAPCRYPLGLRRLRRVRRRRHGERGSEAAGGRGSPKKTFRSISFSTFSLNPPMRGSCCPWGITRPGRTPRVLTGPWRRCRRCGGGSSSRNSPPSWMPGASTASRENGTAAAAWRSAPSAPFNPRIGKSPSIPTSARAAAPVRLPARRMPSGCWSRPGKSCWRAMRQTIQSGWEERDQPPAVVISDSETAGEADDGRIHFRVEQIGHVGLELLLAALAFGAGRVAVACGPQNPAAIRRAVEWQVQMADAVLQGLGMPAGIVRFAGDVNGCAEAARCAVPPRSPGCPGRAVPRTGRTDGRPPGRPAPL